MSDHQTDREALSRRCLRAIAAKELTFKSLAAKIGLSPFITTAALLGQMPLPDEAATKAAAVLELPEAEAFLKEIPMRGSLGVAHRSNRLSVL
jgi:cyanate lyase